MRFPCRGWQEKPTLTVLPVLLQTKLIGSELGCVLCNKTLKQLLYVIYDAKCYVNKGHCVFKKVQHAYMSVIQKTHGYTTDMQGL